MSKSKIQPLIPPVVRRSKILQPLRIRHGAPFPVAPLIAEDIVCLGEEVETDIDEGCDQQKAVAAVVVGCVVWLERRKEVS